MRQALLPYTIAPDPLSALSAGNISLANFWLPILTLAVAAAALYLLARRGAVQLIGLALFVFPLLPAFNIAAFTPEQLVHDRYLYLSLLGILMMIVPPLPTCCKRAWAGPDPQRRRCLSATLALSVVLGIQTWRNNIVWNRT